MSQGVHSLVTHLMVDPIILFHQALPGFQNVDQQLHDNFSLTVSVYPANKKPIFSFLFLLLTSVLGPTGIATVSPCEQVA